LILCGKGNNGGDGAAVGRILSEKGADVTVELFGTVSETKGDARENFERLQKMTGSRISTKLVFSEVRAEKEDDGISEWGDPSPYDYVDVLVDAEFGTGLIGKVEGFFAEQIDVINRWRQLYGKPWIVSIDIPSGLNADSALPIGMNIFADSTVTFTAPKAANVLPPAATCNGELIISDIGSPRELIDEQPSQLLLAEEDDVANWLKKSEFSNGSYKNKRGHALMIAGSRDYSGAAVLCGDAAIRSGCGLVTIATPESSRESIVARVSPEVMVRGIAETKSGSASENAFGEVEDFSANVDVIAVGSGLSSKDDETKRFIERIVDERKTPVVIDADGLTALSPWHEVMQKPARSKGETEGEAGGTPALQSLILTPHEGEFRKLLGLEKEEFEELIKDRVQAVRDFATTHNVYLVLKGERVLIGAPNGDVVVNPTGNSGLGKAGNGDTLTGIITGFIAQAVQMKIDILETLVAAVYIAGLAGDIAEQKFGKRVMTASDVRESLADVFGQFSSMDSD
jgi:NAD(P)H-hydrate epimerase